MATRHPPDLCVQTASVMKQHSSYAAAASERRQKKKKIMSDFLNFEDMGKVTVIYMYQHIYAQDKIVSFPAG